MKYRPFAYLALRIGVAVAFLYPPIAALGDPDSWLGYFPPWIFGLVPLDPIVILHVFGAIEVIIALWILSGRNIRIPAITATAMLLGIVAFNWSGLDVLFRDLSIACMTLALALWPSERTSESSEKLQAPL